jgi:hypothetical protein
MDRTNSARGAAAAGILCSAAFGAGLIIEQAASGGAVRTTGDVLIAAGFVGFGLLAASLILSSAAGRRAGRIGPWLWLGGAAGLLAAGIVGAATGNDDNPLFPVGGLLTTIGLLVAGVAVARAQVLTGWRRWSVAALAGYYLLLLVVNIAAGDSFDQPLLMAGWPVLAIAVGAAVVTEPTFVAATGPVRSSAI